MVHFSLTQTPNPALERTRGSVRSSALMFGARAAQRERYAAEYSVNRTTTPYLRRTP